MSAETVTDNEGAAREAVLRAMQEAAESAAGKNGVPKGYKGTKGIVMLSNDAAWSAPVVNKKKKEDEDDDDDEGSELSSIRPRNLSYSSQSERGPKSPAKRKPKSAMKRMRMKRSMKRWMMMTGMALGATPRTRGLESPSIMSISMTGSSNGPRNMAFRRLLPWVCSTHYVSMTPWMSG